MKTKKVFKNILLYFLQHSMQGKELIENRNYIFLQQTCRGENFQENVLSLPTDFLPGRPFSR